MAGDYSKKKGKKFIKNIDSPTKHIIYQLKCIHSTDFIKNYIMALSYCKQILEVNKNLSFVSAKYKIK
jgi:hypothetical protein